MMKFKAGRQGGREAGFEQKGAKFAKDGSGEAGFNRRKQRALRVEAGRHV
jgi:hypothetical protein